MDNTKDNTKDNTNKLNIKDNNYALEVLSYYLWGQSKAPAPEEIADEKFIRSTSADTTVQIDAQEYMDQIVRPNFELGKIGIFETFFSGATKHQAENKEKGHKKVPSRKITVSDLENIIKTRQNQSEINGEEYALTHDEFVKVFYPEDVGLDREKLTKQTKPSLHFTTIQATACPKITGCGLLLSALPNFNWIQKTSVMFLTKTAICSDWKMSPSNPWTTISILKAVPVPLRV